MQDNRSSSTDVSNKPQPGGQDQPTQEGHSSFEPIKIDQQEGNMNHGTLGGNFGEDKASKHNEQANNDQ